MVQGKMMQPLTWDSPAWALGLPLRVKLVLWLESPQGRREPEGRYPSASELRGVCVRGKLAEKCGQGSRVEAQLFFALFDQPWHCPPALQGKSCSSALATQGADWRI